MASIKITVGVDIVDNDGNTSSFLWRDALTSGSEIFKQEFDLASDGTQIIWDPTNWTGFQVTKFNRMILVADGVVDVEMTTNEGEVSGNEELATIRLARNIPFILGADDSYYNHSASDAFGGTLDVINKIRVDEPNSAARKITMILVD